MDLDGWVVYDKGVPIRVLVQQCAQTLHSKLNTNLNKIKTKEDFVVEVCLISYRIYSIERRGV